MKETKQNSDTGETLKAHWRVIFRWAVGEELKQKTCDANSAVEFYEASISRIRRRLGLKPKPPA